MPARPIFRSILIVSLDEPDPKGARDMAIRLRPMPGVRHIEVAAFRRWWKKSPGKSARQPLGVLIFVEANSPGGLDRAVRGILKEAEAASRRRRVRKTGRLAKLADAPGPETMEFSSMDAW